MMGLWAVVPAAGASRRMASKVPKQYATIAEEAVLEHTLRRLLAHPDILGIVVALDPSDEYTATVPSLNNPRVSTVSGGAERADSVLSGLNVLTTRAQAEDWVIVHDAARPCLPLLDLERLIGYVNEHRCGAILAEPSVDTIKQVDNEGQIVGTLDRAHLWRAQTPQMFRLHELRAALASCLARGDVITDEASAMESGDFSVNVVAGSACNIKITVAEDLTLAEMYLQSQLRVG